MSERTESEQSCHTRRPDLQPLLTITVCNTTTSFCPAHLPGNSSHQLPLQAFVNHELDGGVQHQQQRREGPVPQGSDALLTADLHKRVCKNNRGGMQTQNE